MEVHKERKIKERAFWGSEAWGTRFPYPKTCLVHGPEAQNSHPHVERDRAFKRDLEHEDRVNKD